MRRNTFFIPLLVLLVSACNSTAGPATSKAPDQIEQDLEAPLPIELTATVNSAALFEGTWITKGVSLDIFLPPEGGMLFAYTEDAALNCGGGALHARGSAAVSGINTISLSGSGSCKNSNNESSFFLELTYDPAANVLRDSAGNTWTRS